MKWLLLTVILLRFYVLAAQSNFKMQSCGIYRTDSSWLQHQLTLGFDKHNSQHLHLKFPVFHHQIWVKSEDSTYRYFFGDIWGYRDNGIDYRVYNNEIYEVDYVGKICLYTLQTNSISANVEDCFSKGINGPIYNLSRTNLVDAYSTDSSFVQKIQALPFFKTIFKVNHQNHHYEFINWIN